MNNFNEWLKIGLLNNWVSYPYCDTHDPNLTDAEMIDFDEGNDPCVVVMRVWHGV